VGELGAAVARCDAQQEITFAAVVGRSFTAVPASVSPKRQLWVPQIPNYGIRTFHQY
jgi:hypothetical protein